MVISISPSSGIRQRLFPPLSIPKGHSYFDVDLTLDQAEQAQRIEAFAQDKSLMLVLSRKISQSVIIGGNIRVMLLDIRGNKARLGIQAPSEIPVFRNEVAPSQEAPIVVTLLGVMGKKIRLGIDAPDRISVHRREVFERILSKQALSQLGEDEQDVWVGGMLVLSRRAGEKILIG